MCVFAKAAGKIQILLWCRSLRRPCRTATSKRDRWWEDVGLGSDSPAEEEALLVVAAIGFITKPTHHFDQKYIGILPKWSHNHELI